MFVTPRKVRISGTLIAVSREVSTLTMTTRAPTPGPSQLAQVSQKSAFETTCPSVVLPQSWLLRVWLQEHLYKMLAAYVAAGATIFPRLAPWSALVPVIFGEALTLYFLIGNIPNWTPADTRKCRSCLDTPRTRVLHKGFL
jgi:hypothetical protein